MSTPPVPWFAVVVLGSAFWAAGINITSLPSSSQLLHLFTLSLGGVVLVALANTWTLYMKHNHRVATDAAARATSAAAESGDD